MSNRPFFPRTLRRLFLISVALPSLLLASQAGYFLWVLTGEKHLQRADLIVVFEGEYHRVEPAYNLVDQAFAPNLLISPGTERKLEIYEKRFRPTQPYNRVMEEQSRTTLENAVHTGDLIKENRFESAILVTSWYHMPRSYLLLRATISGAGVKIQKHPVATGKLNRSNWYRHSLGWKMLYNEMVKLWGSLAELAHYRITGELTEQAPGKSQMAARLKQLLLFTIDHSAING